MNHRSASPRLRGGGARRRTLFVARGLLAAAAIALLAVQLFGFGRTAGADSPSADGWWTSTNPGNAGGVAAPAAPPAPPDVPSNGLFIEGGPTTSSGAGDSGATAYAALTYDVPDGATVGKLTLTVAPNSATTPSTTLELCPLTTPTFQPEEGGPMSDAPPYNCANNVTAPQASSSYQFDVSSLVSSGALAVAILPTSPSDRVALSQPDSKSLEVQPPADTTISSVVASPGDTGSSAGSGSTGALGTGSATNGGSAPFGVPADLGAAAPSLSGTASVPAPSAPAQPSLAQAKPSAGAAPATSSRALFASAATTSGPKPWVGLIFLVVLLLAVALWIGAGRSAAAERPPSGD